MAMKWYVVQTQSNCEKSAQKNLHEQVGREGLTEFFGEVLVPTETVVEMVNGKPRDKKVKFLPSYILVQMELNDRTKSVVKRTPKVLGFLGTRGQGSDEVNPIPVTEKEVARITSRVQEGAQAPKPKIQYAEGDNVRVVDGPFQSFTGTVEEVYGDKGKVRVQISIFGRATPVTLDFMQVEKTA